MTRLKVGLFRRLCKFVPGTAQLAVITAKNSVAHERSKRFIDRAFVLNGEVRNAFASIELKGSGKGLSRANIQTRGAGAAVLLLFWGRGG